MNTLQLLVYPFFSPNFRYNPLLFVHFLSLSLLLLFLATSSIETLTNTHYQYSSSSNMLEGIRHPSFRRVSPTRYTLGSVHDYRYIIHVGQIVEFLDFDQTLRNGRKVMKSSEIPLGYEQFADLFNDGAHPKDKRRFSTLTYLSSKNGPPIIEKSQHPVTAHCFRITTSQCGLETSNPFGVSDEQALTWSPLSYGLFTVLFLGCIDTIYVYY